MQVNWLFCLQISQSSIQIGTHADPNRTACYVSRGEGERERNHEKHNFKANGVQNETEYIHRHVLHTTDAIRTPKRLSQPILRFWFMHNLNARKNQTCI